jgi:hypothetical protein
MAGFASPDRLRSQVFSTSQRLHPPRACRPCFMPDPLMGLRPSELFSCRVAVRRLRRRSPLDVGSTRTPSRPSQPGRWDAEAPSQPDEPSTPFGNRSSLGGDQLRRPPRGKPRCFRRARRPPPPKPKSRRIRTNRIGLAKDPKAPEKPGDRDPLPPRPEGSPESDQPHALLRGPKPSLDSSEDRSPLWRAATGRSLRRTKRTVEIAFESIVAFRGLLPATIRHSHTGGLDRCAARSSLELRALQGAPPCCGGPAFTGPSPHGFSTAGANDRRCDPSGYRPQRGWLASLETADPPGLCRLVTFTSVWQGSGSGVASSGPGVRHRPLSNHL